MFTLTKSFSTYIFFMFVKSVVGVVEKCKYELTVLCSIYVDRNNICLYELTYYYS